MNSLLSPGKPVLTRFKVPGEGAYTLSAELHAPLPRHVAVPSANSSNKSTGTAATPPPPPAGPLGLASVSTVSFVRGAGLAAQPADLAPAQHDPPSPATSAPAAAAQPASASGSSLFSLRKLTGLGSSISSKFGAATATASASDAAVSTSGSAATDDAPLSTRAWMANALSSTPAVTSNSAPDPAPRAPPRAALHSRPDASHDSTVTGGSSKGSGKGSSRNVSDAQDNVSDGGAPSPVGVLVYNASDCILALDLPAFGPPAATPERNPLDPSLTLNIRSPPTSHALHRGEKLQLLVGCVNGEVVYYPDISASATPADAGKRIRGSAATNGGSHPAYYIYNRDGTSNNTRVVSVKWVPKSGSRFIAVHVDGGIAVYDSRHKPHTNAFRTGPPAPSASDSDSATASGSVSSASTGASSGLSLRPGTRDNDKPGADKGDAGRERDKAGGSSGGGSASDKSSAPGHRRTGSSAAGSVVGQHEVSVSRAPRRKSNPLAVWQVGCGIVTDAEFAPDRDRTSERQLLAVSGRDGYLRVLDFAKELPQVAFRSYFGALLCVAWSPDGRFVAAGGEDDLVSVWYPEEKRIVARLEGHTSWVSAVAWDASVAGPSRYRLASAGQDTKLLLWDFDVDMLHPRSHPRVGAHMVRLRSYAREPPPAPSAAAATERRAGKLARLRGSAHASTHASVGAVDADGGSGGVSATQVVGALGRAEVPVVGPVVAHTAHAEPLTHVCFQDFGILTADSAGNVKLWTRPPLNDVAPLSLGNKDAADAPGKEGKRPQRNTDLD